MCQLVVTALTFHDISNSYCHWGIAGAAQIRSLSCFSLQQRKYPGMIWMRRDLILQLLLTSSLGCQSWERPTALLFAPKYASVPGSNRGFFYFGDASSSKKTKTFFTRMSSTWCCRVAAGNAFADWDTAKQTSWTLRHPQSWHFHAVLANRSEKEGKTSVNSIIIIMLSSSCFMFLQCIRKICAFYSRTEVTKRNSRVQLSCFLLSYNWHCGRTPSHKTLPPTCALSALSCKL